MTRPILTIEGLNLKVANQTLFQDLNLELPRYGITALMGPVGIGKSSLLTWLSGEYKPMLFDASWKKIDYFRAPLSDQNRPKYFRQKAVCSLCETMALIDQLLASDPALFCIDEVTAQLCDEDAETVLQRLSVVAQSRSVLMVSHNKSQVADYADSILLLAGGLVQEHTPTKTFFSSPQTNVGRQFLRTGGAEVVRAGTAANQLRSDLRDIPADMQAIFSVKTWDHALRWVAGGNFGVFKPKNGKDISNAELIALHEQGVCVVVVVSETAPQIPEGMQGRVPQCIWHPMSADQVISVQLGRQLCRDLQSLLDAKKRVVVVTTNTSHTAERTVASQLVHMGLGADKAAKVAQILVGGGQFSIENEQLLWDLELANDLGDDGSLQEIAPSKPVMANYRSPRRAFKHPGQTADKYRTEMRHNG
ncbi:MAG: ATP-binding cassette domain-containing protein [Paracoccaceae bacterium]